MPDTGNIFELRLTGFDFPAALPDDKANFRIAVDVRCVAADAMLTTHHAVMPGLDTYFECAAGRSGEPNYVRAANGASFDMTKVDEWDSLILVFKAAQVHAVNVTVFDVNRKDAWDQIKGHAAPLIEAAMGRATAAIPALPAALAGTLGDAADDLKAYALRKLAGGGDRVLFRKSAPLNAVSAPQVFSQILAGRGVGGDYRVSVALKVLAGAAAPV